MTNSSSAATASGSSSQTKIDRSTYMQRYAVADAPSTVDVFMFHSRSADKAPGDHNPITSSSQTPHCSGTHCVSACLTPSRLSSGKGKREQLGSGDTYTKLAAMKDWRKCLSNFQISPFNLDGLQWASVEHYYQAAKFQATAPEFARQFCLTSNSSFCRKYGAGLGGGCSSNAALTDRFGLYTAVL